MEDVNVIHLDDREILSIWYPGEDAGGWSTSNEVALQFRADRIVAYGENGQMAPVPFYAVFQGGEIVSRVPANLVEVHYVRKLAKEPEHV